MSEKIAQENMEVTVELVEWQGKIHCVYVNNHRIAGSKPWAGGTIIKTWTTTLGEFTRALPLEIREV